MDRDPIRDAIALHRDLLGRADREESWAVLLAADAVARNTHPAAVDVIEAAAEVLIGAAVRGLYSPAEERLRSALARWAAASGAR